MNNAIQFHTRQNDGMTEVMRITRDDVWVNPFVEVDEAAKAVLDALSSQVKVLVQRALEEEREACAKLCEEQQFSEIEDETCEPYNMGCRHSAEAIRARSEK